MDKTILRSYGIDAEKGVGNCMNDAVFYERLLSMFLKDESFQRGKAAYEARDYSTLFSCMHELKGVAGGAALTGLYDAVCPMVELVRGDAANPPDEEVDRVFARIETAYARTCKGIALSGGQ